LLTYWVARAWKRLHLEYKDTIINTFRNVGLALNPDGSQDGELKVKGIPDIQVGDYCRDDLPSQQEEAEEVLALAGAATVQRKQEEKQLEQDINNAIAEGNPDDEDKDPRDPFASVTDLLWPLSQCIKRLPARDCYFTAEEAEARDPLVVEDPAEQATESEDDLADSWDNDDDDEEFNPDVKMEDIDIV
jgi:hypothetical protein